MIEILVVTFLSFLFSTVKIFLIPPPTVELRKYQVEKARTRSDSGRALFKSCRPDSLNFSAGFGSDLVSSSSPFYQGP